MQFPVVGYISPTHPLQKQFLNDVDFYFRFRVMGVLNFRKVATLGAICSQPKANPTVGPTVDERGLRVLVNTWKDRKSVV